MSDIAKALLDQGVLGLVVLLLVWAVIRLYRENQLIRDRYEAQRETSNQKIEKLAESVRDVLDSVRRRLP